MSIPTSHYKLLLSVKEEMEKNIKKLYSGRSDSYDFISVAVNPVLDLDKVTTNRKEIEKPTGLDEAIVSEERNKEQLENGSSAQAPGMDTNPGTGQIPGYPLDGGNNSSYNKNSEIINRIFTETLTAQEKAIGTINFEESSMTVALWYGDRVPDDSRLTQEFIDQFKQSLSTATGIPVSRISVDKQKLAPTEKDVTSAWENIKAFLDDYGFFILMLLLTIGLMLALIPRKKKDQEPELAPQLATANGASIDGDEMKDDVPAISFEERSEIKKQIERFVKEKPESVAQLLRNWLSEDWD
jgi:flagellar M-ring protein FliF